jgi:hypothetical protein
VGSIAIYQQVLLLAPRNGATVTTTVTAGTGTIATSATISYTTITNSTATIGNQAVASTVNYTLGLKITLSLNATHFDAGNSVNITLTVQNPFPRTLNLPTSAEDWGLTQLVVDGDDYGYCVGAFPFAIEVFGGYLTESNITLGAPFSLPGQAILGGCHIPVLAYNTFPPIVGERPIPSDVTSGYNNGQSFTTFHPGPYTVVAGDRWGQMVILNFVVEGSAP